MLEQVRWGQKPVTCSLSCLDMHSYQRPIYLFFYIGVLNEAVNQSSVIDSSVMYSNLLIFTFISDFDAKINLTMSKLWQPLIMDNFT